MSSRPAEYLERVYAGILGKVVGVYLGRPFEGWTYQRIMKELGPIRYYVHERLNLPLVVTDDDVSGTFVFIRALAEHGFSQDLSAKAIGKTWLNHVVENRSVFWWGGTGISTEHTAYRNLKAGISAPLSGAIQTNGQTVAEQIGAQIFIDGWALVSPGNPALAAKFAGQAGSVSHDGEAVNAAKLWAAMEAQAFVECDVDRLLDVGLGFIPADSLITKLVTDVRGWVKEHGDWEKTRQKIEDTYGYDKFGGVCHVAPNHAIMIMALLYAPHDFHRAMYIVNTAGWDTDCNSGNVGCLVAIINGIGCFANGPDWLGPLADRVVISSADGGYSMNNCTRIAYHLANFGHKLINAGPMFPPKDGAQYHFSLPRGVQGFQATHDTLNPNLLRVEQGVDDAGRTGLSVHLRGLTNAVPAAEVLTQVFMPPELVSAPTYDLMATPLLNPGQIVYAVCRAEKVNTVPVTAQIRIKVYGPNDSLLTVDGPLVTIQPGEGEIVEWMIPDTLDSQPIERVGVALSAPKGCLHGVVWVDSLGWRGEPRVSIKKPSNAPGDLWHRAWVNGVNHFFHSSPLAPFHISQDHGEGIITFGTRDWMDYRVVVPRLTVRLATPAGLAVRVLGLRRYYALVFAKNGRVALIKARDEARTEIAGSDFAWMFDVGYEVSVEAQGGKIKASIKGGPVLEAVDNEYSVGGIGLVVADGSVSANQFNVSPIN